MLSDALIPNSSLSWLKKKSIRSFARTFTVFPFDFAGEMVALLVKLSAIGVRSRERRPPAVVTVDM